MPSFYKVTAAKPCEPEIYPVQIPEVIVQSNGGDVQVEMEISGCWGCQGHGEPAKKNWLHRAQQAQKRGYVWSRWQIWRSEASQGLSGDSMAISGA